MQPRHKESTEAKVQRPIIKQGRDIPMQNELPVYDVVTGVISSRKAYVALLCAEKIQEMSRASERMVCPSAEIIKKVIESLGNTRNLDLINTALMKELQ